MNKTTQVLIRLNPDYVEYLKSLAYARSLNEPNFSYIDLLKETIFEKWPIPPSGYNKFDISIASGIVYGK